MARVNSIITLSGKVDKTVHVKSKYGDHVREAPEEGAKKDEPALKEQYNRTGFLNNLAGELNRIIGGYSGTLKSSGFYQAVQKRFRKEPLNNRFLLLKQLEGMDVHPKYPLNKLGDARVAVDTREKEIIVTLEVLLHVSEWLERHKVNCYAYEVTLLCWNKSGALVHTRQFSEWVYLTDGLPEFEFSFTRPAGTVHWLLCVKQQAAYNEQPIPSRRAEGMQLITAGTFNKKDMALLAERQEEKIAQAAREAAKKSQEPIVRVKAKTVK